MAKETYINVIEFMDLLKSRGLVIVSADEFEMGKTIVRRRMMKKPALTVKEIVDHQLLPLKSKKGVFDWIESGKIKKDEVIPGIGDRGVVRVLTSAIKRLGYGE